MDSLLADYISDHTTTLIELNGRDKLFIFGGMNESDECVGDAFILDLESGKWDESPILKGAYHMRELHQAFVYKRRLLVITSGWYHGLIVKDGITRESGKPSRVPVEWRPRSRPCRVES